MEARLRSITPILAILLGAPALAQQQREMVKQPTPGQQAPALALTDLLEAPPGTPPANELSWDHFKGKPILLEFWATWCGPCIVAIPHLNKLADEFRDEPIHFIALTDEGPDTIRPFLEKRPMRSWVAMDTTRTTSAAFGAGPIPMTVLIDRAGKVAAVTYPTSVTSQVLRDLIAGKPPTLTPASSITAGVPPLDDPDAPAPIFQDRIRESSLEGEWTATGGANITAHAIDVAGMISLAYGFPARDRIVVPEPLREARYEVVISIPGERHDLFEEVFRTALRASLGIEARTEQREVQVYTLSAPPGAPGLTRNVEGEDRHDTRTGRGTLGGENLPAAELLRLLEQALGRPIIDEIGLAGRYDLDLQWDPAIPGDAARAFTESTGLNLAPATRTVPVLVVEQDS